jgi:CHAD domain-containing protein
MSPSPQSGSKAAARTDRILRQRRTPVPRLNPMMACDTAFRVVARRCLDDLNANHEATCRGDPGALHQMRIALTRLRTAVSFFSPMVADVERTRIRDELKWLNGQLGTVRDLDVAIERLKAMDKQRPQAIPYYRSWNGKRADGHRHLIESTSSWVENGPWTVMRGKQATDERTSPIALYSAGKLTRWRKRLLKKSRGLLGMGTRELHRVRLRNKKLAYSIEFFEDLFPDKKLSRQQTALKHLRKAQRSLGQLNDDANGHALATALQQNGVRAPLQFLSAKREKHLIRTAAKAYRKLAALKPFRM